MNIAFFVFNRPDVTRRVLARIASARPDRLFLVADGPRPDRAGEAEAVAQVREIVACVDWPCEVHRNFATENLGCRTRMSSGIDWVFSLVEEAIILEDDCLPDPSFFPYCQELLERYRHDTRVMHIGGSNFLADKLEFTDSYHFSKYPHIWGWATWRRAWRCYDVRMSSWPKFVSAGLLKRPCPGHRERAYWTAMFQSMYGGVIDTWDYQWIYACWEQNGLAILPAVNLVSNIGGGEMATHTKQRQWFMGLPTTPLTITLHPRVVLPLQGVDRLTFALVVAARFPRWWHAPARWLEVLASPWTYGAIIRRLPVVGLWWARWRSGRAHWLSRGV